MSHPNPQHDRSNEYPSDNYKPTSMKVKLAKKMSVKVKSQPEQVSKEYFGGKWQKVGFYKNKKGGMDIKPIKDKAKTLKASHDKWQER